jgi:hypothetical protein
MLNYLIRHNDEWFSYMRIFQLLKIKLIILPDYFENTNNWVKLVRAIGIS